MTIDLARLEVPAGHLGELVRSARWFGFRGLNITHPCKQSVIEHLDELSPEAAAVGAVNTVVFDNGRARGYNTDLRGFEESLRRALPDADLGTVVLLGAGGAGSAAAHVLLGRGTRDLVVVDPDRARLDRLAASLDTRFARSRFRTLEPTLVEQEMKNATGVVNATPVGTEAHPGMPIDPAALRREQWVMDVVYVPLETELLRAARAIGCRTLDGGAMAVFQAAAAFELFTGRAPDVGRMHSHFAELTAPR